WSDGRTSRRSWSHPLLHHSTTPPPVAFIIPSLHYSTAMTRVFTGVTQALQTVSSIVWLLIDTARETADHVARGRPPFRLAVFFEQTDRAGVGSVPLVAMVSWFLGLTMALLTGYQLRPYGSENLVPSLVAVGFSRELGPLI